MKPDFRESHRAQSREQFSLKLTFGLALLAALRTGLIGFKVPLVLPRGCRFKLGGGQLSDLMANAFNLAEGRFLTGAIGTVTVL